MKSRQLFLEQLPTRADSRIDRGVLVVSYAKLFEGKAVLTMSEVGDYFESAHLARPNSTVLGGKFAADKRVSFRGGRAKALHTADALLKDIYPELFQAPPIVQAPKIDRQLLHSTPFIDDGYLDDLHDMIELYEALHVLENSIRRLIQAVLARNLGDDWWDIAASGPMKRKHEDRLQKEAARTWRSCPMEWCSFRLVAVLSDIEPEGYQRATAGRLI